MMLTVAICTYNRAVLLERTLDRLAGIPKPTRLEYEVIVVNNRCTDNTDRILERFHPVLPLRRILQPIQGLSNARNAAVDAARGDYILWTDDDVLVSDAWLTAYEDAILRHPHAAVLGGPVRPWFEAPPPAWLKQHWQLLASAYATRDLGNAEMPLDPARNLIPYGANYCLRMTEQAGLRYNPSLGRNGNRTVLGEETEVVRRIFQAGGIGVWLPEASVQHWIPQERMRISYVIDYFRGLGRTQAILAQREACASVFGMPRWMVRRFLTRWLSFQAERIRHGTEALLPTLCELETLRGELMEFRGMGRK